MSINRSRNSSRSRSSHGSINTNSYTQGSRQGSINTNSSSTQGSIHTNVSYSPIFGRNVIESNFPLGNVSKGSITGGNAEANLVLPGQLLGRDNQMFGFTKASQLRPQWLTTKPLRNNSVALQQFNSMEEGTICMIDKNGACVPIGHTDPRHTTRSTESMRREFEEIMSDPAATLPDIQRGHQLLRMIHTREAREYLERREREREIQRERSIFRLAQHGTRRLRNGALSGLRGISRLRGMFSRGRANEVARANETRTRRRSRTPGGTLRSRTP